MKNKLLKLKQEIISALNNVKDETALKELEIKFLGRKGEFTALLKEVASLDEAMKKEIGQLANSIKSDLMLAFTKAKSTLEEKNQASPFDPTEPGLRLPFGHLHPITIIENELKDLFTGLGFMVLDGPELESDFFNFEALNIPPHHPARDMQDTFYVDIRNQKNEFDLVMRTHTSPMQVRAMRRYGAPLRCVVPGRVFRSEATDMVHEHTFYQMEGLMIGEGISVANLIAVMRQLIAGIFGRPMDTRVRPGYFPFVEPGIEMDIKCTICGGIGCGSCKHSGWLEILPAGMVHPNVLRHGGIDPDKYTGFAFGLGTTRLAMMRWGIDDIRLFMSGDMRFLEQF